MLQSSCIASKTAFGQHRFDLHGDTSHSCCRQLSHSACGTRVVAQGQTTTLLARKTSPSHPGTSFLLHFLNVSTVAGEAGLDVLS